MVELTFKFEEIRQVLRKKAVPVIGDRDYCCIASILAVALILINVLTGGAYQWEVGVVFSAVVVPLIIAGTILIATIVLAPVGVVLL